MSAWWRQGDDLTPAAHDYLAAVDRWLRASPEEADQALADRRRALAVLRSTGATSQAKKPGYARLTDRECQVLARRAVGCSLPEIARELYITDRTVETHLDRIAEKLNTRNPALLALWAARLSIVDPADVEQICKDRT